MNVKAQAMFRGNEVIEWAVLVAKPKLAWLLFNRGAAVCIVALWLFSGSAFVMGSYQFSHQYEPPPTVPEMERHLEFDDRRFDKVEDLIEKRFQELKDDRESRKRDSDARYKEISDRVSAIWYGIAGIGVALSFGVIKLYTNPRTNGSKG